MSSDIDTLMEMGFPRNQAEKALHKTQHKGVQVAMDWLFSHAEDPDIDDPFEAPKGHALGQSAEPQDTGAQAEEDIKEDEEGGVSTDQTEQVARSLKCDDCGKLLMNPQAAELHAARTNHANFSESVDEVKPLTEEEKKNQLERLQDRLKQKRQEKADQERQEKVLREKMRRAQGKEVINIKQKMEETEVKKMVEQRRREKEEDKLARQRVKDEIERDRKERAAKFAKSAPNTGPSVSSTSHTPPVPSATSPQEKREYTQSRIQIRLTNGQSLTQTFSAKEPLSAVRLYTQMNRSDGDDTFTFMTTFPRKVYTDIDMDAPLDSLDLVPSAVLTVTKPQ